MLYFVHRSIPLYIMIIRILPKVMTENLENKLKLFERNI